MATINFAPYKAVKYVGKKAKGFSHSLARPKPTLKNGDIVIVDKKTAHTLVNKGFEEFKDVESISFAKKDVELQERYQSLENELEVYKNHNNELFAKNVQLTKELSELKKNHLENESGKSGKED